MTERIALYVEQAETAAQPARAFQMTSGFTWFEPAYIFKVRHPSIFNTKRQNATPSDRLIRPLYLHGVKHDRIMNGTAPTCPTPNNNTTDTNYPYEFLELARTCDAAIPRYFSPKTDKPTVLRKSADITEIYVANPPCDAVSPGNIATVT